MAHEVFISYASEDKPIADAVCATLEAKKIRCWIAHRDIHPGLAYSEVLIDALYSAKLLVLIFSSNSNISQFVNNEVERAFTKRIRIIPFCIEDVKPSKSMELFISTSQRMDALTPPMEEHINRLANNVRFLLDMLYSEAGAETATDGVPPIETSPVYPTVPDSFLGDKASVEDNLKYMSDDMIQLAHDLLEEVKGWDRHITVQALTKNVAVKYFAKRIFIIHPRKDFFIVDYVDNNNKSKESMVQDAIGLESLKKLLKRRYRELVRK